FVGCGETVTHTRSSVARQVPLLVFPCSLTCLKDRKSTRLNSSHVKISYAVFCLKRKSKKTLKNHIYDTTTSPRRVMDISLPSSPPPAYRSVGCYFINPAATTEIYTLSLHDALPIYLSAVEKPLHTHGHLLHAKFLYWFSRAHLRA